MQQHNDTKLWPVNQLLQWLDTCDKKFCRIPAKLLPTLLAILKFADNHTWKCWPSLMRLSNITLRSESSVKRDILALEKLNLIHTKIRFDKHGDRDTNLYTVLPNNFWGVGSFCLYGGVKLTLPWCQNDTLTTHSSTHKHKKPSSIKNKKQDKQMQNESRSIKEHEQIKNEEIKTAPMPDELREMLNKIRVKA